MEWLWPTCLEEVIKQFRKYSFSEIETENSKEYDKNKSCIERLCKGVEDCKCTIVLNKFSKV